MSMPPGVVPPNFGGFLAYWSEGHVYLVRVGRGEVQEGMRLTPLNLLQLRKTLDELIEQGDSGGHITPEHHRQSEQLPPAKGINKIIPRDQVDNITGED